MKKMTLIAAVAVLASTFASCKKTYTCTCTAGSVSTTATSGKMTKSDAENWCKTGSANGVTCTLN